MKHSSLIFPVSWAYTPGYRQDWFYIGFYIQSPPLSKLTQKKYPGVKMCIDEFYLSLWSSCLKTAQSDNVFHQSKKLKTFAPLGNYIQRIRSILLFLEERTVVTSSVSQPGNTPTPNANIILDKLLCVRFNGQRIQS